MGTMEMHDRRLAISKASTKIVKPASGGASGGGGGHNSAASQQGPSGRPLPRIVNTDPGSFRRVVQELTGTTAPPQQQPQLKHPSRLQRIAPPPLRAHPPPPLMINPQNVQQFPNPNPSFNLSNQNLNSNPSNLSHNNNNNNNLHNISNPSNTNPNANTSNPNLTDNSQHPSHGLSPNPYLPLLSPPSSFPPNLPLLSPILTPNSDSSPWTNPLESIPMPPMPSPSQMFSPLFHNPNPNFNSYFAAPHPPPPLMPLSQASFFPTSPGFASPWSPSSFLSPSSLFPPSPVGLPPQHP